MQDESLIDLAAGALFAHVQAERELAEQFPGASWTFNPAQASVTAHVGDSSRDLPAQFIATIDKTAGTWTWAWQEAIGVPDSVLKLAHLVHEVGEHRAIAALVNPRVQLHETASLPLQLAAEHLSDASHWLRIETAPGKLAVLSVDAGRLEVPAANALVDIVMSGIALQTIDQHRTAFEAYLKLLGAERETIDENGMRVLAADGKVTATFDAEGRILSINPERDEASRRSARESSERMVAEFEFDDESPFGPSPFVFAATPINAPQLDAAAEQDADAPAFTAAGLFGAVESEPAVASSPEPSVPGPSFPGPSVPGPAVPRPSASGADAGHPHTAPSLPKLPPLPQQPASGLQHSQHQSPAPQRPSPGPQQPWQPQQLLQPQQFHPPQGQPPMWPGQGSQAPVSPPPTPQSSRPQGPQQPSWTPPGRLPQRPQQMPNQQQMLSPQQQPQFGEQQPFGMQSQAPGQHQPPLPQQQWSQPPRQTPAHPTPAQPAPAQQPQQQWPPQQQWQAPPQRPNQPQPPQWPQQQRQSPGAQPWQGQGSQPWQGPGPQPWQGPRPQPPQQPPYGQQPPPPYQQH
ncbi:DUF6882 domain-containing protein [uncultured Gulosibacter sp.]|uniref:DUF6882 domain-containing protein n=1 Tax=uncultured Gulosibacter sp. TaxID=1339167 RepID=UPI002889E4AB|nr:DUF6882 domain-containing protein [uncultured Gulosibacter sp.]